MNVATTSDTSRECSSLSTAVRRMSPCSAGEYSTWLGAMMIDRHTTRTNGKTSPISAMSNSCEHMRNDGKKKAVGLLSPFTTSDAASYSPVSVLSEAMRNGYSLSTAPCFTPPPAVPRACQ